MSGNGREMGYGVTELNILKWFGHLERMHDYRFVKKIYSDVKGNKSEGKTASILGGGSEGIH